VERLGQLRVMDEDDERLVGRARQAPEDFQVAVVKAPERGRVGEPLVS
jgi:hypothetical protein